MTGAQRKRSRIAANDRFHENSLVGAAWIRPGRDNDRDPWNPASEFIGGAAALLTKGDSEGAQSRGRNSPHPTNRATAERPHPEDPPLRELTAAVYMECLGTLLLSREAKDSPAGVAVTSP